MIMTQYDDYAELIKNMTNEQAIEIIRNSLLPQCQCFARCSGKTSVSLLYSAALIKAIKSLESEQNLEKEYMRHYKQGRKDERAIATGELMQLFSE